MKSKSEIKREFDGIIDKYQRLGNNIEDAITSFLESEKIPYLSVYHRIKTFDSFYEKIERKSYKEPLEEIEDFCGVRIICYYASDIHRIEEIIKKEFHVLETEDKSESLGLNEFAYRSTHNIVRINEDWTATPNYRDLGGVKAEIQIRTILMHAWAEVEHKLNYKSDSQVPASFQRKLFRLSAKFEEADEQFEELRDGIDEYKNSIIEKAKKEKKFDTNQDFNLDSFLAFLKFHFPKSKDESYIIDKTFHDYAINNFSFEDLEKALLAVKPYHKQIAKDLVESGYHDISNQGTEILGFGMHATGTESYEETMTEWKTVVDKWSKKLQ